MPWLSSSAWTTLASMFEAVRKMTVRPAMDQRVATICAAPLDLHDDHRHVVVLIGAAGEGAKVGKDERAQLLEGQVRVLLQHLRQPRLAVAVERLVHRLADAVGIEDQQVAVAQRHRFFLDHRVEHLAVIELEPEHQAVGSEDLRLAQARRRSPGT